MNEIHVVNEWDLWRSHQGDQSQGDSATWNVVDDHTVVTSRTLHAVRAMSGILRHTGLGIFDVQYKIRAQPGPTEFRGCGREQTVRTRRKCLCTRRDS